MHVVIIMHLSKTEPPTLGFSGVFPDSNGKAQNTSHLTPLADNTQLDPLARDSVFVEGKAGGAVHPVSGDTSSTRDLLQLDATLKKIKCTLHYAQVGKVLPIGKAPNAVVAELALHDLYGLMELKSDGSFHGDAWVTELTVKEVPSQNGYGTLEREAGEGSYIVHQELYYKKTKPPKLGGGTMDTRRGTPDDTIFKISVNYVQQNLEGIILRKS